ncbi:MAG TPA: CHAD domain-containing protein, partial [Bacteroidales bacterium]|nr:CHAD domain-containing protein [Bacteroidales bacterium]
LSEYLNEAMVLLKKSPVPDDDSVHDMRVLLKKSRAVLKLIGPQTDQEYNQKDINSLKDAARLMSGWRDTTVLRKTLKELKKEYPDLFAGLSGNQKIDDLLKKHDAPASPSPEMANGIEEIENLLKKTAYRIRFQSVQNPNPRLLLKELQQTYQRGVEHFVIARNSPKEKKLHDLRKKSKDFLYQLYFFRPLNSRSVKALEKRLESITKNLGRINDLAQLITALGYDYTDQSNTPAYNELIIRMREKQDKYLEKVWPQASKIFCPGISLVNLLGYKLLVI